jgi:3-oxoacyl-[acyl-carrier-protein] synthase-1
MRDPRRQVVISGMGACCNLGDDLDGFETRLRTGDGGSFRTYDEAVELGCRCTLIGLYDGDLSDSGLGVKKAQGRFLGRASRLALKAAQAAIAQAGIDPEPLGVIVGSGTGDVAAHLEIRRSLERHGGASRILPTYIPRLMASTVSANLVNVLRCKGPSCSVAAACAGGAYNMLMAAQLIEAGHMDAAIAGGAEVADPHFYVGFDAMRAYNEVDNDDDSRASRPYAADRAGFVFGEGAGVVVLETLESARRRGAEVYALLGGWGMSSDGEGNMVQPSKDGAKRAMKAALRYAGLEPASIDYINTHGTSTPLGDVSEVEAIRSLVDNRLVPYGSTKGFTGHTVSAAGTLEAIFTTLMMGGDFVAPSIHADPLDPALEDFPPVQQTRSTPIHRAMSNSFGFGGTNVALILQRPPR